MRIRFINSNEPVTTFYRDLVPFLSERGHSIDVITSRAEYRLNRNLDGAIGHLPGVRIIKTTSMFVKEYNKSRWSKLLVRGLYSIHALVILLFGPRADLNVFLTQPPFFHAVGAMLRRLRGQDYICVVMDVQPQQYVEFGLLKRGGTLTRLLGRVAANGYRNARTVVVIGRCMADRLAEMGVDRDKIVLIPNWTDESEYRPVERSTNSLRSHQGWGDDFVVAYGGNIGYAQDFDPFIEAADLLRDKAGIRFVLIGGGTQAEKYRILAAERGLDNFELLPFLHERHRLDTIYGAADLSFISLRSSCTGLGVPSKAYSTLAVGRPILYLGSADGEIARMVAEEDVGAVVHSAEQLAAAVVEYAADGSIGERQGPKARALADGHYSRASALQRYADVMIARDAE